MQDIRAHALQEWLNDIPTWSSGVLSALDGDASFRRYFRYQCDDGKAGIVMDAPPPQEDVRPFLVVQEALAQLSVDVPVCYAQDVQRVFVVGDLVIKLCIKLLLLAMSRVLMLITVRRYRN